MNIKRAKEEIKNTVKAYLAKDEFGEYIIPSVRQRPILLMGAPGIGKTAVMEQIAGECSIGLVSYSITHHTRQSAVGLPFISKKIYGGKEYSVTEYTMSEIIASVYDKITETGFKEGILFIDEVNCVSETLAPSMLQFLQAKTFGTHKVPEGWIIVTAGNPPEYNKSVREFDVVTLDRMKVINVEPDYDVWKEYAWRKGINGAILSYLDIKKSNFYIMENTVDGKRFVTARGWEDLSTVLDVYKKLGIKADENFVYQYLQHKKTAKDFANYIELYEKYRTDYNISNILNGNYSDEAVKKLENAPFDEKLSVIGLILSSLSESFRESFVEDLHTERLYTVLKEIRDKFQSPYCKDTDFKSIIETVIDDEKAVFDHKKKTNLIDKTESKAYNMTIENLENYINGALKKDLSNKDDVFQYIKEEFSNVVENRQNIINNTSEFLNNAFGFIEKTFGTGQEMVIFITELTANYYSVKFIKENGCDKYFEYNKELLFDEKEKSIIKDIENAKTEINLLF
ncbi:ATPase [Tyzzerella sp. An114]|uniref:ATP-binding protein n=1 Tax=Tyzzerella sp. An114 TaxID=1965545 RepID=UPI000B450A3F|nr:AAA family ATPase [Tyzzerella sp. An114]OUQ56986.1 ATPase [Tyzzerella sp. An114]